MSVYSEILQSAKLAVQALDLSPIPSVYVRKRFTIEQADPQDMIVLSPLEESEVGEDEFENVVIMDYPILVGLTTGTGQLADGSDEDYMLTYRELVRHRLRSVNVVSPSGGIVIAVKANTSPAFDRPAARDNRNVSAMIITYTLQEQRIT